MQLPLKHAKAIYFEEFLTKSRADQLFEIAMGLPLAYEKVKIFDSFVQQPRKTCVLMESASTYSYSGLTLTGHPFPDEIRDEIDHIMNVLPHKHPRPDAALCNLYEDGKQYIGQHSDKETNLAEGTCIVSLSLGATRHFDMNPRKGVADDKYRIDLTHGSLLVMYPGMQQKYTHGVPKELTVKKPRINITFRCTRGADTR